MTDYFAVLYAAFPETRIERSFSLAQKFLHLIYYSHQGLDSGLPNYTDPKDHWRLSSILHLRIDSSGRTSEAS